MKKLLLFAAVAGLGLVSASPPPKGPDNGPREARRHYPPCSRTVTDRCIQLYERGVRAQLRGERHARIEDHPDNHRRGHGVRAGHDDHRGRMDHAGHGDRGGHRARLAYEDHRGRPDLMDDDGPRRHRVLVIRDERRGRMEHHARGDHRYCPDRHARGDHRAHVVEHRPVRRVTRIAHVQRAAGCRCSQPRRHYAQRVRRAGERG